MNHSGCGRIISGCFLKRCCVVSSTVSGLVFWEKYKIWVCSFWPKKIESLNFIAFKNGLCVVNAIKRSLGCSLLSFRKDRLKKIQIKSNGVVEINFPSIYEKFCSFWILEFSLSFGTQKYIWLLSNIVESQHRSKFMWPFFWVLDP